MPDPMLPRPYRVTAARRETADVATIEMAPADGSPCLRFLPAQFGMIGNPGLGEVPISFSSDAADTTRVGMTIRAVGAITRALVGAPVGTVVGMRGPYGVPWPVDRARGHRLLVVAGGLGLAPLRALLVEAARTRDTFTSVSLAYGTRSPAHVLFRHDLEAWSGIELGLTVDHPDAGWRHRVGLVTELLDDLVADPVNTVVMMCGPDVMLTAVGEWLLTAGIPAGQIWATLERNMKCGIGLCGHCQLGPFIVCRDGPVADYGRIRHLLATAEV